MLDTSWKAILPSELKKTPFEMIGKDWMLITAGTPEKANTMTASWGGMGVLWGKDVVFAVIRPQRYTKRFVDENPVFSLSFLGEQYRSQLGYLGKASGKDEDKIAKSGLTLSFEDQVPFFDEAETVLLCKKLYAQEMTPQAFTEMGKEMDPKWYPQKDYHILYVAEITKVLTK